MSDYVSLNHGSGGKLTDKLIEKVFVRRFGMAEPLTDSAILKEYRDLLLPLLLIPMLWILCSSREVISESLLFAAL